MFCINCISKKAMNPYQLNALPNSSAYLPGLVESWEGEEV